jgi:predicted TIM-barrel fold metal-dependent hydrolase
LEHELRRQFYDVASIGLNPAGMEGLRKLIPSTRMLYGSDEPFTSTVALSRALPALNLPPEEVQQLRRGNALRLFPRLDG